MRDDDTGPTAGQTLPGGLCILNPVGSTPEGTLYHGEYPDGREVAVLLPAPGSSEDDVSRLGLATQIQHPNVARIYEVGELEDGSPYVVLEKVDGETLSQILAAGDSLPLPEALYLALQIAAGLEAAHRLGFVHGNLSPESILVTEPGGDDFQIKLIRFEIDPSAPARAEARPYASPQRLAGHAPDDVYSLGAILHRLLTGMPPTSGGIDASIPGTARYVLVTALALDSTQRFHSISDLHAALERLARHAGARRRPGHRRALTRGAAGAALAVLIAGVSLIRSAESPPATEPQPVSAVFDTVTSPTAPAPAATVDSTPRRDTLAARRSPPKPTPPPAAARSERERPAARRDTTPATAVARDPRPATPPPEPPSIEDRAQVYLRVGLDEARRQLGGPVHAIEGMSPLFHGLARSSGPPFADTTRPVVRSVYMGPNEELVLLDQQRIRPGAAVPPLRANSWRDGDVILYLHGDARPEMLQNLAGRVR